MYKNHNVSKQRQLVRIESNISIEQEKELDVISDNLTYVYNTLVESLVKPIKEAIEYGVELPRYSYKKCMELLGKLSEDDEKLSEVLESLPKGAVESEVIRFSKAIRRAIKRNDSRMLPLKKGKGHNKYFILNNKGITDTYTDFELLPDNKLRVTGVSDPIAVQVKSPDFGNSITSIGFYRIKNESYVLSLNPIEHLKRGSGVLLSGGKYKVTLKIIDVGGVEAYLLANLGACEFVYDKLVDFVRVNRKKNTRPNVYKLIREVQSMVESNESLRNKYVILHILNQEAYDLNRNLSIQEYKRKKLGTPLEPIQFKKDSPTKAFNVYVTNIFISEDKPEITIRGIPGTIKVDSDTPITKEDLNLLRIVQLPNKELRVELIYKNS